MRLSLVSRSRSLLLTTGGVCCLLLTLSGPPAAAQQPMASAPELPLPQASPRALVLQTIGLTDVTVDYHAPGVKGRPVWGTLVPWNQVWRAGANENTLITFSEPVKVNGQAVPAGKYSFYVLPQDNQDWQLILNRVTTHWGSEGYDAKDDLLRVPASSEAAPFHETLLYWFSDVKPTTARLNLTWEKRTVSMTIETEVHEQALRGIQQTLAATPNNWQLLAQAADYLVQNNLHGELALRYINESIRLRNVYTNNWIKARLLASKQDYTTAIAYARKAIKLGDKSDDTFKAQLPGMRIALTDWQAKAY
ncbi:conserved hypothetical protein [Hymenobacter roseosalivarius DSM 11622]|uniref:DUF2911 domain-containing protein n=1 Tax=Hymenobacter roseosalivarius DSM 11622 TaxID=645990 RepID=A0A1W1W2H6_9BACT|nr:DUF2911 domain-containing protein [Hymenobacter roseosalivarius]SMB99817.1 conserved hypothetical protein [Hymenobacter roseosalivarius DSM 11622]